MPSKTKLMFNIFEILFQRMVLKLFYICCTSVCGFLFNFFHCCTVCDVVAYCPLYCMKCSKRKNIGWVNTRYKRLIRLLHMDIFPLIWLHITPCCGWKRYIQINRFLSSLSERTWKNLWTTTFHTIRECNTRARWSAARSCFLELFVQLFFYRKSWKKQVFNCHYFNILYQRQWLVKSQSE